MQYVTLFGIVLLAAVASFMIGWFWYSEKAFGVRWMRELGISKDPTAADKKNMGKVMAIQLVGEMVKAFFLLFLSSAFNANQFFIAIVIWIGFLVPSNLPTVLYEKRSWNLFMINIGYQLLSIVAMAFVFYII